MNGREIDIVACHALRVHKRRRPSRSIVHSDFLFIKTQSAGERSQMYREPGRPRPGHFEIQGTTPKLLAPALSRRGRRSDAAMNAPVWFLDVE